MLARRRAPAGLPPSLLLGREQRRKVFILGNSPSINDLDLSRLRGHLSIGMNASPLLAARYGFSSAYYCVSDRRFLADPAKFRIATTNMAPGTWRIIRADIADADEPGLSEQSIYLRPIGRDGFSEDPRAGFYFGSSTAHMALQVAYWLGCTDIVLLGCDFDYGGAQQRFYSEENPAPVDMLLSVQVRNIATAVRYLTMKGIAVRQCGGPRSMLRPYVPHLPFDALT